MYLYTSGKCNKKLHFLIRRTKYATRDEAIIFHHDYARPHVAIPVKNYLKISGWEVCPFFCHFSKLYMNNYCLVSGRIFRAFFWREAGNTRKFIHYHYMFWQSNLKFNHYFITEKARKSLILKIIWSRIFESEIYIFWTHTCNTYINIYTHILVYTYETHVRYRRYISFGSLTRVCKNDV